MARVKRVENRLMCGVRTIEARKIADGVACARKYLQAASFSWLDDVAMMMGTKPNRFNSSPIHMENHLCADNVIRIPDNMASVNK